MNATEIGKTIKDRQKELNLNQQELADLAEIGINSLVDIEKGKANPRLSTIIAITDTLGLNLKIELKLL